MIGGMVSAYRFGFSSGNLITGFGLPIGKALTGVTAGLIMKRVRVFERQKATMVLSTTLSYIPEGVFTVFIFTTVFPVFFPTTPLSFLIPFTIQIIVKAFFEMVVMGLLLAAMIGNQGFTGYVKGFFAKPEGHFQLSG